MKEEVERFEVDSKLLSWAIDSSGWGEKELSEKMKISEKTLGSWLEGTANLTYNQLIEIAKRTKRPIASFFLQKPPKEKPLPKDYRLHPKKRGEFDKQTIFAIRKARKLQEIVKNLMNSLYEDRKKKLKKRKLIESPRKVAEELRSIFGLTEQIQRKFRDPYQFKNFLRQKLEHNNIFVFQISMPEEDARGFALADSFPNVVSINSKDSIEARIFTMMHEVGHILLKDTSISIPDLGDQNVIEKWCNEFASSFLLPPDLARKIFREHNENLVSSLTLKSLSRTYKLSKNMLLYNMAKLRFITFEDYHEILERYKKYEKIQKENSSGGPVPVETKCLSELGEKFVSLVAENTQRNNITYSDALGYLSIKSHNFDRLIKKI
jgi:Zn-dependent peptidase ImmA (M78 family)